jgi:hypothetical protein
MGWQFMRVAPPVQLLRKAAHALRRLCREWIPALSDRRDRAAFVAVLAVFALLAAPIAQLSTNRCNQCPVTCPMHHEGHDHAGKPTCHGAHPAGVNAASDGDFGCNWTRPPCGHTGILPATGIGPMVLGESIRFVPAPLVDAVRNRLDASRTRLGDPPDTPPPIFSS